METDCQRQGVLCSNDSAIICSVPTHGPLLNEGLLEMAQSTSSFRTSVFEPSMLGLRSSPPQRFVSPQCLFNENQTCSFFSFLVYLVNSDSSAWEKICGSMLKLALRPNAIGDMRITRMGSSRRLTSILGMTTKKVDLTFSKLRHAVDCLTQSSIVEPQGWYSTC